MATIEPSTGQVFLHKHKDYVDLSSTQTLTNKTLTSPIINTTITGNALTNVFASATSYVGASVANPAGTAYAASAGTDPSVTLTTGTKALVIVSARFFSAGNYNFVGFAVSGATTIAGSDANAATTNDTGASNYVQIVLVTLNAGSNTFTMQYKCNVSASGSYDTRSITVIALP